MSGQVSQDSEGHSRAGLRRKKDFGFGATSSRLVHEFGGQTRLADARLATQDHTTVAGCPETFQRPPVLSVSTHQRVSENGPRDIIEARAAGSNGRPPGGASHGATISVPGYSLWFPC